MNYTLLMQNTTTKEVYTFDLENQNYSENIYYKFDITLSDDMPDENYVDTGEQPVITTIN